MNNLKELFEQFIKAKKVSGKSPVTIKNYRDNFELLLLYRSDLQLSDLNPVTIVDFLTFLNERDKKVGKEIIKRTLKNSSMATVYGKLSSFCEWLHQQGHIAENPFSKIPYPNVEYTDKRAFKSEEVEKICNAINTKIIWPNLFLKKRNISIVMTLLLTGIRKGELLGLQITDIDMKRKLLTIRAETSKSRRTRTIPISSSLIPYLEDYLSSRDDYSTPDLWVSNNSDRSFTDHGAKHLIEQLTKVTGINCHLHRFRHTFAVNYYLQSNNDIMGLHHLLGHRTLKMTIGYLRSLTDDKVVQQMQKMAVAEFI